MKINIIAAGKTKDIHLLALWHEYFKRFKLFKINLIEVDDRNLNKKDMNLKLFKAIKSDLVIILDEKGQDLTSLEFSKLLNNYQSTHNEICFVIGGAEGIEPNYKSTANLVISLGKLTLPHQLARILLIEQIYRAETIIFHHPYHKI